MSSEPADEISLRKCAIMKSKWRRATQKDRDRLTLIDFIETLLDNKNSNIHKNVNGTLAMRLPEEAVTLLKRVCASRVHRW